MTKHTKKNKEVVEKVPELEVDLDVVLFDDTELEVLTAEQVIEDVPVDYTVDETIVEETIVETTQVVAEVLEEPEIAVEKKTKKKKPIDQVDAAKEAERIAILRWRGQYQE
jgi:L-fucose mutarotase/ribose pyranase (RbsD/FucU family)